MYARAPLSTLSAGNVNSGSPSGAGPTKKASQQLIEARTPTAEGGGRHAGRQEILLRTHGSGLGGSAPHRSPRPGDDGKAEIESVMMEVRADIQDISAMLDMPGSAQSSKSKGGAAPAVRSPKWDDHLKNPPATAKHWSPVDPLVSPSTIRPLNPLPAHRSHWRTKPSGVAASAREVVNKLHGAHSSLDECSAGKPIAWEFQFCQTGSDSVSSSGQDTFSCSEGQSSFASLPAQRPDTESVCSISSSFGFENRVHHTFDTSRSPGECAKMARMAGVSALVDVSAAGSSALESHPASPLVSEKHSPQNEEASRRSDRSYASPGSMRGSGSLFINDISASLTPVSSRGGTGVILKRDLNSEVFVVAEVICGGAPHEAGIRAGDQLLSFSSFTTGEGTTPPELGHVLAEAGRTFHIIVERDGKLRAHVLRRYGDSENGPIGVAIKKADGNKPHISHVVPRGLADLAALQEDDIVVGVGTLPVSGMGREELHALLAVDRDSPVVVGLSRPGASPCTHYVRLDRRRGVVLSESLYDGAKSQQEADPGSQAKALTRMPPDGAHSQSAHSQSSSGSYVVESPRQRSPPPSAFESPSSQPALSHTEAGGDGVRADEGGSQTPIDLSEILKDLQVSSKKPSMRGQEDDRSPSPVVAEILRQLQQSPEGHVIANQPADATPSPGAHDSSIASPCERLSFCMFGSDDQDLSTSSQQNDSKHGSESEARSPAHQAGPHILESGNDFSPTGLSAAGPAQDHESARDTSSPSQEAQPLAEEGCESPALTIGFEGKLAIMEVDAEGNLGTIVVDVEPFALPSVAEEDAACEEGMGDASCDKPEHGELQQPEDISLNAATPSISQACSCPHLAAAPPSDVPKSPDQRIAAISKAIWAAKNGLEEYMPSSLAHQITGDAAPMCMPQPPKDVRCMGKRELELYALEYLSQYETRKAQASEKEREIEFDVQCLMTETGCSRGRAVHALKQSGDVVEAIMGVRKGVY